MDSEFHHKALCWIARLFLLLDVTHVDVMCTVIFFYTILRKASLTFEMSSQMLCFNQNSYKCTKLFFILIQKHDSCRSSLSLHLSVNPLHCGFPLVHLCPNPLKSTAGIISLHNSHSLALSLSLISGPLQNKSSRHTWHFHFRYTLEQWMWIPHPEFITIHCPQVCLHFSLLLFYDIHAALLKKQPKS